MNKGNERKRIETRMEVQTYIDRLKYAIQSGSVHVAFQKERGADRKRDKEFTNRYTLAQLFQDEDETVVMKRELAALTISEYRETVKDLDFPKRSEFRVFGRKYLDHDVFIKFRVQLVSELFGTGDHYILVLSFHFAEWNFNDSEFPFR